MDPTQEPPFTGTARIGMDGTVEALTGNANQYWIDERNAAGDRIVPFTMDNPAHVGLPYDEKTGVFTQPELAPNADLIAEAYERGKADGAAELLAAQADAEAL